MRNDKLYLKDILKAMNKINQYTENLSKEEFKEKEMIVDAVLRNIEILMKLQISFPRIFMKNMMKFPGAK